MLSSSYLALHGWNGRGNSFQPLVRHLPAAATLYSPDLQPRDSLDTLIAELEQSIAALPRPVTVIGNCSGAILALLLAERRPHEIERLVLIDAFAYWPWYFKVFLSPSIGRYAYYATFANPLGRWLTDLSLAAKRTRDTSLTDGFVRTDHRANYRFLLQLAGYGSLRRFGPISAPIDIVYGEHTFSAVKESAQKFQTRWPQARIHSLTGAGHQPLREATAQLSEIVFGKGTACRDNVLSRNCGR